MTGFLVTDYSGNPKQFAGLPVTEIKEITELPDNCAVIVAMAKEQHSGPAALLEQKGVQYYLYAKGELSGPYGKRV